MANIAKRIPYHISLCLLLVGCCLLSLLRTARTFPIRLPSFVEHRIVDHVDQLRQLDESGACVPPPHLFRLPAPGGDVCLIVDEIGSYHVVRDRFPPLGLPVSETAVVDSQINAIGDTMFGTRFHLSDGTVRGSWCPGGTAGPFLRLARRLPHRLRHRISMSRGRPPMAKTRALEVLAVEERPDGSLTLMLPSSPTEEERDAKIVRVWSNTWLARRCGLAGYDR